MLVSIFYNKGNKMNKIGLISIFSSFLLLAACEQNSDSNDTTNDNETVVQSLAEQQTEASSNEALASSNYPNDSHRTFTWVD